MSVHCKYLLIAAAVLVLGGCTVEDMFETDGRVPILLTAQVEASAPTRAGTSVQDTQFASGETFNVYFPSGASLTSTTFQTSDGSGTTECTGATPFMQAGVNSCTVHAYYPSSVSQSSESFSVEQDQSSDANYKASDLMYATATVTKVGTSASGCLSFNHRMSKILVTAMAGNGVATITEVGIVSGKRTVNITAPQSCTLGTTLSDASYIRMWTGVGSAMTSSAALIPPQVIDGDFLQVVTNLGTATYTLDSKTFAQGTSYQFNLTVNAVDIGARTGYTAAGNENWQ